MKPARAVSSPIDPRRSVRSMTINCWEEWGPDKLTGWRKHSQLGWIFGCDQDTGQDKCQNHPPNSSEMGSTPISTIGTGRFCGPKSSVCRLIPKAW